MKVIFLQNTMYQSHRYCAGESADVPEDVAKKLVEDSLAYAEDLAGADEPAPSVSKPARRKKVQK